VLGDDGPEETAGRARIRFVPFEPDGAITALHYIAADLYLHAAHADTFPLSVLEALACGTPVVATAVGGIPEQLVALPPAGGAWAEEPGDATGVLVGHGEAERMGRAVAHLLSRQALAARLGANARADAEARFGISLQVKRYLTWYDELLARHAQPASSDA
jgi:glycosyltransferase involved in cell wall biosynthesis